MSFSFFHSFIFLELCFFELITLQFLLSTTLAINFITDYIFTRYPKRWWQDVYWGVLWYPKMAYNFFFPPKFSFLSSKTCEFFIFYTKLIKKNNLCDVIKLIKLEIFFAFWFLAKTIKKIMSIERTCLNGRDFNLGLKLSFFLFTLFHLLLSSLI